MVRVILGSGAEAFEYPPYLSLTASNGVELAGHWGDDFITQVEAPSLDLNHLAPRNQILQDCDTLGFLPVPKGEQCFLSAPAYSSKVGSLLPWNSPSVRARMLLQPHTYAYS